MPSGMLQESDTFINLPVFTNIYSKTLNSYVVFVNLVKICKAANSSINLLQFKNVCHKLWEDE
jgi:hypothetical protein